MRDVSARMHDILNVGLQHPPRRELGLIAELKHDFIAADHRQTSGAIGCHRVGADVLIGDAEGEHIVRPGSDWTFDPESAVDVPGNEIAIRRRHSGA